MSDRNLLNFKPDRSQSPIYRSIILLRCWVEKLNAKRNVVMVTENESCMLFLGLFLPFIASVTILSTVVEFQDFKKNQKYKIHVSRQLLGQSKEF